MATLEDKNFLHSAICRDLAEIYKRKNSDYNDAFSKSYAEYGMAMPCIRLEDKLNRFKALTVQSRKLQVDDEPIEDTLMDLANYAIMTLIEIKNKKGEIKNG